jgi:hypothetical protein
MTIALGRGLFRLAIALWAIWIAFGLAYLHKELASYFDLGPWSEHAVRAAAKDECDKSKGSSIDCIALPLNMVKDEQSKDAMRIFLLAFIALPMLLIVCCTAGFFLMRWVLRGFRGS